MNIQVLLQKHAASRFNITLYLRMQRLDIYFINLPGLYNEQRSHAKFI